MTLKKEIKVGSLVEIDLNQRPIDTPTLEALKGWKRAYNWPMRVHMRGDEHVTLEDNTGKIIYFGSTGNPSFHVAHVKLAE